MASIESLNKLFITKNPSTIRICNHGRTKENKKKLFKSHKKFKKMIAASYKDEAMLLTINIVKVVQFFILYK